MNERKEVLVYGMTLPDVYMDTPFHDDNWVLLRFRKNKRAFCMDLRERWHNEGKCESRSAVAGFLEECLPVCFAGISSK